MRVAVVGLGIAGLSICARLAEAGHTVSGFEQYEIMHARGSSHGDTRIFRLTPGEGDIYVRMAERALPTWLDWQNRAGTKLLLWTTGLMAGRSDSAFVTACERLSQLHNHHHMMLRGDTTAGKTRGVIRFPADWRVCLQEECGVLFADAARRFLIRRCEALGVKLHADTPIAGPLDGPSLTIKGEKHQFAAIIVATGSWLPRLLPETANLLVSKRRIVGWLKPEKPLAYTPPVICVDNDAGLFGMPAPDKTYKIGLHSVGEAVDPDNPPGPNAGDAALLFQQAAMYLPMHDPTPIAMKRCLYTMTADENFLIAPSQAHPRVLMFSCCSGHGFKYAPAFGDIARDWLEGRDRDELHVFGLKERAVSATQLGKRA